MKQNEYRTKLDELTKKSHTPVLADDEVERGNTAFVAVVCFLIGLLVVATIYGRMMA